MSVAVSHRAAREVAKSAFSSALEANEWAVQAEEEGDEFVPAGYGRKLLDGFHVERPQTNAAAAAGEQEYRYAAKAAYRDLFARTRFGSEARAAQDATLVAVARFINREGDAHPVEELAAWLGQVRADLETAAGELGEAVVLSPVVRAALARQDQRIAAWRERQLRANRPKLSRRVVEARKRFDEQDLAGTIARCLHSQLAAIRNEDGVAVFGERGPVRRSRPKPATAHTTRLAPARRRHHR